MYLPGKKSPHIIENTVFNIFNTNPDSSAAGGSSAALFSRATKKVQKPRIHVIGSGCLLCMFPPDVR